MSDIINKTFDTESMTLCSATERQIQAVPTKYMKLFRVTFVTPTTVDFDFQEKSSQVKKTYLNKVYKWWEKP